MIINFISHLDELLLSSSLYWFCALAGSGMFLIHFLLSLFGMTEDSFHSDIDIGHHYDADFHSTDVATVKWLSVQAMTGFLMMFGWTALTCQHEFKLHSLTTLVVSCMSGLMSVFMIRSVLKLAKKLISPGTVFRIHDALGKEGYIYQRIPKDGKGKVLVSIESFTHELDAVSDSQDELPSWGRVKIISLYDNHTVTVTPLK